MLKAWTFVSSRLAALKRDERGVSALEYGVIAAIVIVVGLAGLNAIGGALADTFGDVLTALTER